MYPIRAGLRGQAADGRTLGGPPKECINALTRVQDNRRDVRLGGLGTSDCVDEVLGKSEAARLVRNRIVEVLGSGLNIYTQLDRLREEWTDHLACVGDGDGDCIGPARWQPGPGRVMPATGSPLITIVAGRTVSLERHVVYSHVPPRIRVLRSSRRITPVPDRFLCLTILHYS